MPVRFWSKNWKRKRIDNEYGGDSHHDDKSSGQNGPRTQSKKEERICKVCGRTAASIEDLMNHKQIFHGKDLQYECRTCNVGFSSMEEIRTHMQRKHAYTGSKTRHGSKE